MNIRNHTIEIQCSHRDVNDVAQALIHSIIFFRTHGKFNYKHEGSYSIGTLGFERAFCDNFDFTYIRCSALSLVSRINNKVQEFADRIHEFTHSGTISLEFFNKRPNRWPFNDSKIVWELWNIKISITQPTAVAATMNQPLQISPSAPPPTSQQQQQSSPSFAATAATTSADTHHHHHQQYQQRKSDSALRLEDLLSHKLLDIVKIVNSEKCSLPQMPTQPNLDTVFDTSFSDLQPYLYNISYKINEIAPGSQSVIGGTGSGGGGTSTGFGGSGSAIGGGKYNESGGGTIIDASAQSSLKKFLLGTLEL